jgi:hypothetical protein
MDKAHSYIAIKSKSVKRAPIVTRLNIEKGCHSGHWDVQTNVDMHS